jgi:hypothetical protein
VAEGTRLLSGPRRNPSAGSNPALSATTPATSGSFRFWVAPTRSRGGERSGDESESLRRLRHDERCREPEHPVAEAVEVAVAAPVGGAAPLVVAAVHLHDEPRGGGEKVRDIATDGNLTAESDAESAPAKELPQRLLRRREMRAHLLGVKLNCC